MDAVSDIWKEMQRLRCRRELEEWKESGEYIIVLAVILRCDRSTCSYCFGGLLKHLPASTYSHPHMVRNNVTVLVVAINRINHFDVLLFVSRIEQFFCHF